MTTLRTERSAKVRGESAPAPGIANSKPDTLADEISALTGQGVDALRLSWAKRFRCPAPPIQSADTLRRLYAWKLQADAFGDLDPETVKLLDRARRSIRMGKSPGTSAGSRLRTGMILVREWRGTMHRVLVCDGDFEHNGKRHRTLSEAARAITGTRWSGPRFFGLTTETQQTQSINATTKVGAQ